MFAVSGLLRALHIGLIWPKQMLQLFLCCRQPVAMVIKCKASFSSNIYTLLILTALQLTQHTCSLASDVIACVLHQ